MPVTPTFPGVYIEEIPSGVRTIVGVATNIAAFLGRAISGPLNKPTIINSFADFERQFGGLGVDFPMSYAVNDFYQNGGSQAVIVRLFSPSAAGKTGFAQITADTLNLAASSPGAWGNALSVTVDVDSITDDVAKRFGLQASDLFNLTVSEVVNGQTLSQERFLNLTVKPDAGLSGTARAQRVDRVLTQSSQLVTAVAPLPAKPPSPTPSISGISPTSAAPAAQVTITGKNFGDAQGKSTVSFNGVPAPLANAKDWSAKSIAVPVPAGAATGPVTVTVIGNSGNPIASNSMAFTVLPAAAPAPGPPAPAPAPPAPGPAPAPAPAPPAAAAPPPGDDGGALQDADFIGDQNQKTGLFALDTADLFNLLCIPPDSRGGDTSPSVYSAAMTYSQTRRAMLIVDSPAAWSANPVTAANVAATSFNTPGKLNLTGDAARNAALYFPRVQEADPLSQGQICTFVPCGIIAGVMARTDVQRGVWKAPAGIDAALNGISALDVNLTNAENGQLNPLGINCLRTFPVIGSVVWGSRTARGADQLADDYKYVPVRRLALFMEESLYRGTQWVVFEPNDEPLWAQIRLNVGAFMHNLFVQGAFQGQTPADAYFVKCDKNTTTQNDINLGIVNIVVGFAPLKPAEFVIIQIQQIAGNILT